MVAASAERARKLVIPCREREEFRVVVLARAARLLAGAVMVRLIRAFPATPSPARPPGPRSIRLA
jgi:hypothetical protein